MGKIVHVLQYWEEDYDPSKPKQIEVTQDFVEHAGKVQEIYGVCPVAAIWKRIDLSEESVLEQVNLSYVEPKTFDQLSGVDQAKVQEVFKFFGTQIIKETAYVHIGGLPIAIGKEFVRVC